VAAKRVRVRYEPTKLDSQDVKDAVARAGLQLSTPEWESADRLEAT